MEVRLCMSLLHFGRVVGDSDCPADRLIPLVAFCDSHNRQSELSGDRYVSREARHRSASGSVSRRQVCD